MFQPFIGIRPNFDAINGKFCCVIERNFLAKHVAFSTWTSKHIYS